MSEGEQGWIAPDVQAELPDLRLHWLAVDARAGRSPAEIRERLRDLSDAVRGNQAVMLRRQAVPHAYRVFFRHVGLDPDRELPPHEALVLERLRHGSFRSRGLPDDALTIATMETGIPLWALDAEAVEGDLGVRTAGAGEEVGGLPVPAGRLVVADARKALAVLFGTVGAPVGRATRRVVLVAVRVAGVPAIHVEEALWVASGLLAEPPA